MPSITIDAALDADQFTFVYEVHAPPGTYRLMFRARSGSPADTLIAELWNGTVKLGSARSAGTDTSIGSNVSVEATRDTTSGWTVLIKRVAGANGSYSLRLFKRDSSPESVSGSIVFGQTIDGEKIDVPYDVDRWKLKGKQGQEWAVTAFGTYGGLLQVVDSATNGLVLGLAVASPDTNDIMRCNRSIIPHDGTYYVTVSHYIRASYGFRVDTVHRGPEAGEGSANISIGSVVQGAIATIGDVDEYTFTGSAGQEINVLAQLMAGTDAAVHVWVYRGSTPLGNVEIAGARPSIDDLTSQRITLPKDTTYMVRVTAENADIAAHVKGAYKFELYRVNRAVEDGAVLAVDAPPVTSALDRTGDVDEFPISLTAGQLVVLRLISPDTVRAKYAHLLGPDGTLQVNATAGPASEIPQNYSVRLTVPVTGSYKVRVSGYPNPAIQTTARGSYSLELYSINPAPEHIPSTFQYNDSVGGESVDRPGDMDTFTIIGDSTKWVNVFFRSNGGYFFGLFDGPGLQVIMPPGTTLSSPSPGRIRLQQGATYTVRADAMTSSTTGPYAFRVVQIDTMPEGRPDTFAVGDTVSETLGVPGDMDYYTFTLATSTKFSVYWSGNNGATAQIRDAAGTQLWVSIQPTTVTLPAGTYSMRVWNPNAQNFHGGGPVNLPYKFAIVPQ